MSKRAFLYAGQGAQVKGMGKDLYEAFSVFQKAYDEAELDFDLKQLSFIDPEEKLNETRSTQPALVAFATGMTAAWDFLSESIPHWKPQAYFPQKLQ